MGERVTLLAKFNMGSIVCKVILSPYSVLPNYLLFFVTIKIQGKIEIEEEKRCSNTL